MQITKHIHALRIPFKIQITPEVTLDRFVYAFIIGISVIANTFLLEG